MTTISTLAQSITEQLSAAGAGIEFKSGTILEPLAGEICSVGTPKTVVSIESLATNVNEHYEDHDPNPFSIDESENLGNIFSAGVEGCINDILPIALGIVDRIKNGVIPFTNEIFETAYNETNEKVNGGGFNVQIVTDGMESPLFANVALSSLIEMYSETGIADELHPAGVTFPEMGSDELRAKLLSVNSSINGDLESYLGDNMNELLVCAYNHYFNRTNDFEHANDRWGGKVRCHVIAMLLAIAFVEDIPEGVEGVDDVNQYRRLINKMAGAHAAAIRGVIVIGERGAGSGNLVLEYPAPGSENNPKGACIIVHGPHYDEWLESGGSVDVIYGAYITDRERSARRLMEGGVTYEREWNRYAANRRSSLNDNFETIFRNRLTVVMHAFAKTNDMTMKMDGLTKFADNPVRITPENAYAITRCVVCDVFYPDGEYDYILGTVDLISKESPNIELSDAIDIAIQEWLVVWAFDQIKITH